MKFFLIQSWINRIKFIVETKVRPCVRFDDAVLISFGEVESVLWHQSRVPSVCFTILGIFRTRATGVKARNATALSGNKAGPTQFTDYPGS